MICNDMVWRVVNMENEKNNVSYNENNKYISYSKPNLKNKRGYKQQTTASLKKFKSDEEVKRIIEDMNELLTNYEEYSNDYSTFIQAKDKFHEFAVKCVFEKTEFFNRYNQEIVNRTLENYINLYNKEGKYAFPATLFTGVSGSGKTTTLRQIIGSINTSYPATMQANTTVGNFYIVVDNNCSQLVGSVRLTNKAALEERIKMALLKIIKCALDESYKENNLEFIDVIYDALTIYEDRKCKLEYIIKKDDIKRDKFDEKIKRISDDIWKLFKQKYRKDSELVINEEFSKNTNTEFMEIFGEFVLDNVEYSIIEELLDTIKNGVINIIELLKEYIYSNENLDAEIILMDESKVVKIGNYDKVECEIPKMLTIRIKYSNGELPDKELREIFFKAMEYVSSASEKFIAKTLYPILEEMRIRGNFKPVWSENINYQNYILIDSEGLGHDMSSNGVSVQLRDIISESKNIVFIQNGSEAINENFAEALKVFINTGSINKTKYCFNRMEKEKFDSGSNVSEDSRLKFVKSGISNAIKTIVQKEEIQGDKIVTGREHIYEKMIKDKSFYFEYLDEYIDNDNNVILKKDKERFGNLNDIPNEIKEKLFENLKIKFSDNFNSFNNINKLIQDFTKDNTYSIRQIEEQSFTPIYRADKFSSLLNNIANEFYINFLKKMNSELWQTIKAFNVRIAENWDYREWRNLTPESDFIGTVQEKMMAFLSNPENLENIKHKKDESIFLRAISQMMDEYLAKEFRNVAKKIIYEDMLESCWKPAKEFSQAYSTFERKKKINEEMENKFKVDYENKKYNQLYPILKNVIFDNIYSKALKMKYD